jgi:hypothetical protein
MSGFWQVAVPAAVALLVAYQGAISRTIRLRRDIKADVELLAALPADHPSRPVLEAHIERLVGALVQREARRFDPAERMVSVLNTVAVATLALYFVASLAGRMMWCGQTFCAPQPEDVWWLSGWSAVWAVVLSLVIYRGTLFPRRQGRKPDPQQPPRPAASGPGRS